MCAWGGGHRVEETLLRRQPGRSAGFGTPGQGEPHPPPRGRRQRRWEDAGETKPPLPPRLPTLSRRDCRAPPPRCGVWQQGRTVPSPPCGRSAGRGGAGALPAAPHRFAPPQRHSPRRPCPAEPRQRCAGAAGGSRCRGGGSGGGRCWRANRGPARRRESLAGAQGGRAAAIRAPRGRPPPVYVSGCRLCSSALRPQRLPARAPCPRRGDAAGPGARRPERLGRQARRGAAGGSALLGAAAAARPWLPARRRRR